MEDKLMNHAKMCMRGRRDGLFFQGATQTRFSAAVTAKPDGAILRIFALFY